MFKKLFVNPYLRLLHLKIRIFILNFRYGSNIPEFLPGSPQCTGVKAIYNYSQDGSFQIRYRCGQEVCPLKNARRLPRVDIGVMPMPVGEKDAPSHSEARPHIQQTIENGKELYRKVCIDLKIANN